MFSLRPNDGKAWFSACWYKFMEIKSWSKIVRVGVLKNECDHSGQRTIELAVSQEGINGTN